MMRRCLLVALTLAPAACPEVVLPAARKAHVLILQKVYLNGEGPFRMMIDTGNASSIVRPAVARRLELRPSGMVEQATPLGTRTVPRAWLREVRAGTTAESQVETLIAEPGLPGLDGVLGQSWLVRHDYLVDYRGRRLVLDGPRPSGVRRALRSSEGVPEIAAEVDGVPRELTIDSGAPALVLYGPATGLRRVMLASHATRAPAGEGSATVSTGGSPARPMTAVWIEGGRATSGLLPVCEFDSVYVSNREGFVVLTGPGVQ